MSPESNAVNGGQPPTPPPAPPVRPPGWQRGTSAPAKMTTSPAGRVVMTVIICVLALVGVSAPLVTLGLVAGPMVSAEAISGQTTMKITEPVVNIENWGAEVTVRQDYTEVDPSGTEAVVKFSGVGQQEGPTITSKSEDGQLTISVVANQSSSGVYAMDVDIYLPAGLTRDMSVSADSIAGSLQFQGEYAQVIANSDLGNVTVSGVVRSVNMTTKAGTLRANGIFESLNAASSSGNIYSNSAVTKDVEVDTDSGEVSLDLSLDTESDLTTVKEGSVPPHREGDFVKSIPDGSLQPVDGVSVNSVAGDVDLMVPKLDKVKNPIPYLARMESRTGLTVSGINSGRAEEPHVPISVTTDSGAIWMDYPL